MGMSLAQWRQRRPKLTRENEVVVEVWNFCGGWNPELLSIAFAYYDVRDPSFFIAMLLALRDKISDHRREQEKAMARRS
jgi:hypothetical protein